MDQAEIRDTPQGGDVERLLLEVIGSDFPEVGSEALSPPTSSPGPRAQQKFLIALE